MITLPTITFRMKLRHKIAVVASLVAICLIGYVTAKDSTVAVLQPRGHIAQQQYDLMLFASLLSLVVVIPVFMLLFFIVWRYREGNTKATYKPNWGGNTVLELVWWGIPIILIAILSVVTWQSSHALDPYKPLASDKKPVHIQVVALQWKWLFIYPEQGIATVNYVQFPSDRPVNFELTSDAPMNSFWIPQLGGQVYAMSGMSTKLHLMADKPGTYTGMSANISGEGFASMRFTAESTTDQAFERWVAQTAASKQQLNQKTYSTLATPSLVEQPAYYTLANTALYDTVIEKYMSPTPLSADKTPPAKASSPANDHTNHEGMGH